jgi:hypothetical protein
MRRNLKRRIALVKEFFFTGAPPGDGGRFASGSSFGSSTSITRSGMLNGLPMEMAIVRSRE